jgi:hypothetical protein
MGWLREGKKEETDLILAMMGDRELVGVRIVIYSPSCYGKHQFPSTRTQKQTCWELKLQEKQKSEEMKFSRRTK